MKGPIPGAKGRRTKEPSHNSNFRAGHDGSVYCYADIECSFLLNDFAKVAAGLEARRLRRLTAQNWSAIRPNGPVRVGGPWQHRSPVDPHFCQIGECL
jgi:hypothetical protein